MARPRRRAAGGRIRSSGGSALAVPQRRDRDTPGRSPTPASWPPAAVYARPVTCRLEVFVRSGHTIDLALEDGEDRVFVSALHEAWASPDAIEFKHLALGQHAVILAGEVVGYRLHGSVRRGST